MNAHKRLHGFDLGLNCTASAKFSADRGRDRTMNRPNPRRGRRPASRIGRARRTSPAPPGCARLYEAPRMTPDPEVRQELVARVRQEIRAGTYDTPEKLEAAVDRLAACLDLG